MKRCWLRTLSKVKGAKRFLPNKYEGFAFLGRVFHLQGGGKYAWDGVFHGKVGVFHRKVASAAMMASAALKMASAALRMASANAEFVTPTGEFELSREKAAIDFAPMGRRGSCGGL